MQFILLTEYLNLMFTISFPKEQFISPTEPFVGLEPAIDCDGSECGIGIHDEDGTLIDLPPHFHTVESQPGAWTRRYPIGGKLPADFYQPSH
jgi:hypothetical protein